MAKKNKATLSSEKDALFADNTAGDISSQDMRDQTQDDIDSFLNIAAGNPEQVAESPVNFTGGVSLNGVSVVFGTQYQESSAPTLATTALSTPIIRDTLTILDAAPTGRYLLNQEALLSVTNNNREVSLDAAISGVPIKTASEPNMRSGELFPAKRSYFIDHINGGGDTVIESRFWATNANTTAGCEEHYLTLWRVS